MVVNKPWSNCYWRYKKINKNLILFPIFYQKFRPAPLKQQSTDYFHTHMLFSVIHVSLIAQKIHANIPFCGSLALIIKTTNMWLKHLPNDHR